MPFSKKNSDYFVKKKPEEWNEIDFLSWLIENGEDLFAENVLLIRDRWSRWHQRFHDCLDSVISECRSLSKEEQTPESLRRMNSAIGLNKSRQDIPKEVCEWWRSLQSQMQLQSLKEQEIHVMAKDSLAQVKWTAAQNKKTRKRFAEIFDSRPAQKQRMQKENIPTRKHLVSSEAKSANSVGSKRQPALPNKIKETEGSVKYANIITEINALRTDDSAAHYNMLWWGILDLRAKNVPPNPNIPRAEEFLPGADIKHFQDRVAQLIHEEKHRLNKSVDSLLKALSLSDIISIRNLADEYGSRGVVGLHTLLEKELCQQTDDIWVRLRNLGESFIKASVQGDIAEACQLHKSLGELLQKDPQTFEQATEKNRSIELRGLLRNIDENDEDTVYVGRCLLDANAWIRDYNSSSSSERTVDMNLIGPFARVPHIVFTYGENQSDADREEKTSRSDSNRSGKPSDYLFWDKDLEAGIGENTGPKFKDHHDKTRTDFLDVIKVARAQHIRLKSYLIEDSNCNPLSSALQEALTEIMIPFFHITGTRIRFYVLLQVNGDLYAVMEWASEFLPRKDADIGDVILLCEKFLTHRNLVNRVGRLFNTARKRAKVFRESITREIPPQTVEIKQLQTPQKPKQKKTIGALEEE